MLSFKRPPLSSRSILAGAFLAAAGFTNATAHAATYSYTFTAGTPTIDATAHTVSLPIYLNEAITGTGSSQINSDGGLYSFGITASITDGPGTITSFTRNSAFDETQNGTTSTYPATTASIYADQNVNFPNGVDADASGNVPIATLLLGNVTASTTFTLQDINTTGFQTVDYAANGLDPTTVTQFTVPTPEPATIALALLGLPLFLSPRRAR
ncbi:MAG TPA: hypothetical protein VH253_03175 [Phycisphaerae bacterium]|nr:hypothetical protein [Phycisphaerae bacterium]